MEDLPMALVEFVEEVFGRHRAWLAAGAVALLFVAPLVTLLVLAWR